MNESPHSDRGSHRILLVEPEPGGHHFVPYAAALARALREAGNEPSLLTTASALAHAAWPELERIAGGPVRTWAMPEVEPARSGTIPALLRAQFAYWRAVRRGIRGLDPGERPALVVLLGLDSCDRAIAMLGSPCMGLPFVGLTVQAKHHWSAFGIGAGGRSALMGRWTFSRVLAHRDCLGVATIDETLVAFEAQFRRRRGRLWWGWVPDPGEVRRRLDRRAARAALRIDADERLVLAYGAIDGRKNVQALLAAARLATSAPTVALVGRIASDVRELADGADWKALERGRRLLVRDGFATLEEEALWFGAADLVWVGYRDDFLGQSAVIPLAASAGVPVIGRRGGLIGRTIESAGLGGTVDPDDPGATAAAIDALLPARAAGRFEANLSRFARGRTLAAYGQAWTEALAASWPVRSRSDETEQSA